MCPAVAALNSDLTYIMDNSTLSIGLEFEKNNVYQRHDFGS